MLTQIRGKYEDGKLILLEKAPVEKADVIITFLEERHPALRKRQPGGLLRLGELEGKRYSIPDDFNEPLEDLNEYMY
jgi:hypothetical protein